MMNARTLTTRAIFDALALRGLESGDGGFIRSADPTCYMDPQRLRLAREAVKHLPAGASVLDVDRLADGIEPMIRAMIAPPSHPAR